MNLPLMSRGVAAASRLRAAPRATLTDGKGRYRLLLAGQGATSHLQAPCMAVSFLWGSHSLRLFGAPDLVGQMLAGLDPGLGPEALRPDLLGLLIEAALLEGVTALERGSGQSLKVEAITAETGLPDGDRLSLTLGDGERHWPLELVADRDALAAVLEAWPVAPQAWAALPMPAVLRLGSTRLPLAVLRSLAPDDSILLQTHKSGGAVLVLAEARLAAAEYRDGTWRLTEAPRATRSQDEEDWMVQRDEDLPEHDEAPGGLDDIPVQVAFDLGRIAMPLGELRRMGAGTVIETGRNLDEPVRITANGRLVGHGVLVDLEGRVGVQIVRLFDHG